MDGYDEASLVRLVQLGDLGAFERLLKILHAPIRAYISGLANSQNADDVLQEVSLQIFREVRFLREPQAFRAWVYRIATRTAFRHMKREKRWESFERDPEVLDSIPDQERLFSIEQDASFLALIRDVSPASRVVLLLHYQQELPLHEVAAILDLPLGTAKSRLAYGVSTLRKLMKEMKSHA